MSISSSAVDKNAMQRFVCLVSNFDLLTEKRLPVPQNNPNSSHNFQILPSQFFIDQLHHINFIASLPRNKKRDCITVALCLFFVTWTQRCVCGSSISGSLFLICSWLLWLSNHLNQKEKQKGKCSLVLWNQLASGLVSLAWNGQKMVHAFSKISLYHELILLSFAPSKRLQTSSWLACAYNLTSMAFSKERCPDDKDLQLAILISQGWGKPCSHACR